MLTSFLHVAIGGAIGSCLRFAVGIAMLRMTGLGFPVGVLSVNILGSFLMGLFMVLSIHRQLGHLNPLVMSGFLGGFTTFSAFSLEAYTLYERGQIAAALGYVAISVLASIGALVLGVWLARTALT